MLAFARLRASRNDIPDMPFTLGTGHMVSCVRYGLYLAARHQRLVGEMHTRGFNPTRSALCVKDFPEEAREIPSADYIDSARKIVQARITQRLRTARRTPTWTNREKPHWISNEETSTCPTTPQNGNLPRR